MKVGHKNEENKEEKSTIVSSHTGGYVLLYRKMYAVHHAETRGRRPNIWDKNTQTGTDGPIQSK